MDVQAFDNKLKWLAKALPDGGYWYLLGMRLGMPENEMRSIRSSLPGEDQCKFEILNRWRNCSPLQPTMHTLLQALCAVGLKDLAQQMSCSHEKAPSSSHISCSPEIREARPQKLSFHKAEHNHWSSNHQPTPYDDIERDSRESGHVPCPYVARSPYIDTEKDMKKTPTPTHASPLPGEPRSQPLLRGNPNATEARYVSRGPHHTFSSGTSSNSSALPAASVGGGQSNAVRPAHSHGTTPGTAAGVRYPTDTSSYISETRYWSGMGSTLASGPGVSGQRWDMGPVSTYTTTSNHGGSFSTDLVSPSSSGYSGFGHTYYSGYPAYQPLSSLSTQDTASFRQPDVPQYRYNSYSGDSLSMPSISQCSENTAELLRSSCTSPHFSLGQDSTAPSSQQLDNLAHETNAKLNLESRDCPLQITREPEDCEVLPNAKVEFVCEAHIIGSDEEPSFQWYKGNDPLVGEINNQYIIEQATQQDVGAYCCVVTDSTEMYHRTSHNAKLLLKEVNEPPSSPQESTGKHPPVIVKQPDGCVEAPAEEKLRLVIEVKGEPPLQYTWFKNTKELRYAKSNVLEIPNATHLDSGHYCCSIANDYGSILSSTYSIKVIRKPVARGTRRSQNKHGPAMAQSVQQPMPASYHKYDEHLSKPRISVQPYTSTVVYGQTVRLFIDVENPDYSTTFQWYRNNRPISGREGRELLIHSVIDSDGGDYFCRVSNRAGSTVSQIASISISNGQGPMRRASDPWGYERMRYMGFHGRGEPEEEDEPCGQPVPSSAPPIPRASVSMPTSQLPLTSSTATDKPVILEHPQSQEIEIGDPLTLSCTASGSGELSYLWYFNGLSMTKETQSTYTIHCFTDEDEGLYACKVSSDCGSAMSQMAHVVLKLD